MFRVSSRSISGPFHRYGHPSLTRGTAHLRQFHHISALCSEFDTKPDTKPVDAPTDSNATSKPPKAQNRYISWSSKLLGLFGGSFNSPASEVSQATPSQSPPEPQPTPPSQPPHPSKSDHIAQRRLQRRNLQQQERRELKSLMSLKIALCEKAKKESTEEDLRNPTKRAELLNLLDNALECAKKFCEHEIEMAKQSYGIHRTQSQKPQTGAKEVAKTSTMYRILKAAQFRVFKASSQVYELQEERTQLLLKFSSAESPGAASNVSTQRNTIGHGPGSMDYKETIVAESPGVASNVSTQRNTIVHNPVSMDYKETIVAESPGAASNVPTQRKKIGHGVRSLDSKENIIAESPGAASNFPTQRNTIGHSPLFLDSKENIVAQILESSSRNAPAATQVDPEAQIKASPKADDKESLAHISKYIETKSHGQLSSNHLHLTALDAPMPPVPGVSYGLDRVLFNPGVYHLRDPRSRVYNFDPYLSGIMPVSEFDFTTLKPYITSSKDVTALEMSAKHQKKYYGSSSSMTSALSHFHYLLSAWRPIDTRYISQGFSDPIRSFTRLLRAPIAMFVHYKEKEDVYAIDADKEFDSSNILMHLGKSMEKLLTLPKEEFERYRRSSANKITSEEEESVPESYHYTSIGNFLMRSQLDAYDPRLPGTGMYDLKTRAVVSVRMDGANPVDSLGYEIKDRFGNFESYEREYFDMIRSAFLKYSLQVRVGRMDGIFVAYHNIERIFGFQYISLPEMDQSLHGQSDTTLGDKEFELSLGLWEKILDRATAKFPKQSLRFHFETRVDPKPFMYIFAQPVTSEQIHEIQTKNAAQIEALQDQLFNPGQPRSQVMDLGDWAEPELSPDEGSEAQSSEDLTEDITRDPDYDENLLAMTLVINNTVNGEPVERPRNFRACDEWTVSYELNDLNTRQGNALLKLCKRRRAEVLDKSGLDDPAESDERGFIKSLWALAEKGRKFRQRENHDDQRYGITVYGEEKKSV